MSYLDRRTLVTGIAAMIAGPLVAPVARAMQAEVGNSASGPAEGFDVIHPFLSNDQRAGLAAISERIVPTTDTPGAIAAGVPAFIEMMLADWHTPAERDLVVRGLADIDAFAVKSYARPYAKLDAKQQDAILTLAMDKALPGASPDLFEHLRQLVVYGYYSSEIGCTLERVYLPVPGRYDGFYPYSEVKRVFAS